jgi:hypothetical protein
MSKLSAQELDLQIQLSLVARIKQAAHMYKAAPAEAGSAALESYVAALECLAEHIAAKCRGSRLTLKTTDPAHRLRAARHLPEPVKPGSDCRVIPFPSATGNPPLTAA